jgi:hypothetical protein
MGRLSGVRVRYIRLQSIILCRCGTEFTETDSTFRIYVIEVLTRGSNPFRLFRISIHTEARCLVLRLGNECHDEYVTAVVWRIVVEPLVQITLLKELYESGVLTFVIDDIFGLGEANRI